MGCMMASATENYRLTDRFKVLGVEADWLEECGMIHDIKVFVVVKMFSCKLISFFVFDYYRNYSVYYLKQQLFSCHSFSKDCGGGGGGGDHTTGLYTMSFVKYIAFVFNC